MHNTVLNENTVELKAQNLKPFLRFYKVIHIICLSEFTADLELCSIVYAYVSDRKPEPTFKRNNCRKCFKWREKFRVASRIELIRNDAIIQYVSNMSQIYRYGLNHLKYLQIIFFSRRYSQFTFSSWIKILNDNSWI